MTGNTYSEGPILPEASHSAREDVRGSTLLHETSRLISSAPFAVPWMQGGRIDAEMRQKVARPS